MLFDYLLENIMHPRSKIALVVRTIGAERGRAARGGPVAA
ncbi:conserved hypothetical protein [Roseovarius sp. EC-HK134]|jgi:hypothetical protein|nr:Hypothetical protein RAK1035_3358 [Roseovarius sp. AK1035]EDM29807.1 hypothetical protein RTM1035_10030 [Roseovarius sp. TM1035]VVT27065.1 conserved hypothetical protein [Roseovarius sp. EC-HK134]